jgi:hypothetical protein
MTRQSSQWDGEREEYRDSDLAAEHNIESSEGATVAGSDTTAIEGAVNDSADGATPPRRARPKRASGQKASAHRAQEHEAPHADNILDMSHLLEAGSKHEAEADSRQIVQDLESQGFTPDEALRLIHISDLLATSREAREAEATMRRLRFTRWLFERGVLSEFSA